MSLEAAHDADADASPGYPVVRLALGARNVLVPVRTRRAALAGISLVTRSRRPAVLAQWALYGAVASLGRRLVRGESATWVPPGSRDQWDDLVTRLEDFDELALYERPQASRTGLAAVLLRGGRPVGFLKLRDDPTDLDREERATTAVSATRPSTFRAPRVLDRGELAGWHWTLAEAMPPRPASPARRVAVRHLVADIERSLESAFPRPSGVPEHWRPMHGDLTPWNLRRCGRGLPWLIDWEDVAWAPPGADQVYYEVTSRVVLGRRSSSRAVPEHAEAARFWLDRIASRSTGDHDAPLNAGLRAELRARLNEAPGR